jgi:hypothetical protein
MEGQLSLFGELQPSFLFYFPVMLKIEFVTYQHNDNLIFGRVII